MAKAVFVKCHNIRLPGKFDDGRPDPKGVSSEFSITTYASDKEQTRPAWVVKAAIASGHAMTKGDFDSMKSAERKQAEAAAA